jgi:Transposase IS66 family
LPKLSGRSEVAGAIRYALSRWVQLCRYRDNGTLEIDNNAAERASICIGGAFRLLITFRAHSAF